jgi:hypothetical protein
MATEALWKIGRPDCGGHEDPSHLARSARSTFGTRAIGTTQ